MIIIGAESAGLELPTDTSIPVGYLETFQPSKRHIGSLARQGLLPSIRAARFSRSPRYLVDRENSADGPTSNYSSNPTTWSLRPIYGSGPPRIRFLQSLCRYCHHGFRRSRSITDGR
ncbi:hypothetical protein M0804_010408 [Polistes exclamans]|nr:hypothetical protein M0804_010408 [Polistes exclamans]